MMSELFRKKCRCFVSNLSYKYFISTHNYDIMSFRDTIEEIERKRLSAARFGDGEFKWMLHIGQESFQDTNSLLSDRLEEVLLSNDSRCLICVPGYFSNDDELSISTRNFSHNFIRCYGKKIASYLSQDRKYGDSYFTRCYRSKNVGRTKDFDRIKKIWHNRNILVVEGELTRFGVGNDLLDNARSVKRIIAPSKNAFSFYDSILQLVKKKHAGELVLISLGPTATVLAYDLSRENIQAIDIGHLDIEYEWCIRGSHERKILIPGKYVNEAGGINSEMTDTEALKEYKKQIIAMVGVNE